MKEKFSLKDALFNESRVTYLADLFLTVDTQFPKKEFIKEVLEKFPELELKARITWIAEVLTRYLPSDPSVAMKLIVRALPPELDPSLTDNDFGTFIMAPLGEYVVRHGCTDESVEQALDTLYEITKRFSMEDAIRPFLNNYPRETLARLDEWVGDPNYHVRRLVSEGTRPLLPWSRRLTLDCKVPLKYLDQLYTDNTRYVTRSVANHLNDISKKDPALVIKMLAKWHREGKQDKKELTWITKHALRTLIKKGESEALAFIGFASAHTGSVTNLTLEKNVLKRGDRLVFSCTLGAEKDSALLVDYVIDFVKANGGTKPKVFKLKQLTLKAGETLILQKSHHLKADATTFTLRPGVHTLTIQVNGLKAASISFTVQ
jgi:3-methyladenine DNA glycosylase AlkC